MDVQAQAFILIFLFTITITITKRLILEYGNVAWGPNYKLDEDLVEKVQRKATKLVSSIRYLLYEERLRCLGLPSLKYQRLRGDMIMTYITWSS